MDCCCMERDYDYEETPPCNTPEPELQDPGEYMFHMQCRISKLDIVLPYFPKIPDQSICQQTCLTVSFLEFPELILCDDKNEEQRRCCYNEDEPYFLCGKSILFSLSTKFLERYLPCVVDPESFQLLFKIYEVEPYCRDARDKLLGCCVIPLGEKFAKMWKTASNGVMHEPPSFCVNDDYNFIDPAGHMKGTITAFVKMSCFGKTIVTQCHTGTNKRETIPSGLMKSAPGSPKCDKPLQIESYCQTDKQISKIGPCSNDDENLENDQGKRCSVDSGIEENGDAKLPDGAEDAQEPKQPTDIDEMNEQEVDYEEIEAKLNGHILYFQVLKPQKRKGERKKYPPTSKALMAPPKEKSLDYESFKKSLMQKQGMVGSTPLHGTGIQLDDVRKTSPIPPQDPYSTIIDSPCPQGCRCNWHGNRNSDANYSPYFKDSYPFNVPASPEVEKPPCQNAGNSAARRKLDFGDNDRDSELCGIPRTPPTLVSPRNGNDEPQDCMHKREEKEILPNSTIKEVFSLNVGKKFTADGKARPKMTLKIMAPKTAEEMKAEMDAAVEGEEWIRKMEQKRKGIEFISKDTQVLPEDFPAKPPDSGKKAKGGKGKKGGGKKKK